ncbi:MAG TPA: patatin-like phospholipase family protein [Stellaceae bacterium]|nr:patatin-like phospholipase family protein [Stellaceae bacterium]
MNPDAISRSAELRAKPANLARDGGSPATAPSDVRKTRAGAHPAPAPTPKPDRRQVVLVLQGGGALGAYQAGVYQGLCEGGIVPDWVIGTSIGAINGAIIAGNPAKTRMTKLQDFWASVASRRAFDEVWSASFLGNLFANMATIAHGVPGFFQPNLQVPWGLHIPVGVERAAFYSTEPLRRTLAELVDFDHLGRRETRLTVGAVNVRTAEMTYFDSRDMDLSVSHIMASGALPPAFPAVRIGDDHYWDGGVFSNTPVEAVLDDKPRRDSLIFSVNMWQTNGPEPASIWQVFSRQKDIQYASRGKTHVARQDQIHRLRHVVRELEMRLSEEQLADPVVRELVSYGCRTEMHLVRLLSPRLDREDHTKDIDFTRAGISTRWRAGYEHARRALAEKPWEGAFDALKGIIIHEIEG